MAVAVTVAVAVGAGVRVGVAVAVVVGVGRAVFTVWHTLFFLPWSFLVLQAFLGDGAPCAVLPDCTPARTGTSKRPQTAKRRRALMSHTIRYLAEMASALNRSGEFEEGISSQ